VKEIRGDLRGGSYPGASGQSSPRGPTVRGGEYGSGNPNSQQFWSLIESQLIDTKNQIRPVNEDREDGGVSSRSLLVLSGKGSLSQGHSLDPLGLPFHCVSWRATIRAAFSRFLMSAGDFDLRLPASLGTLGCLS
jgi:hypothetical protein